MKIHSHTFLCLTHHVVTTIIVHPICMYMAYLTSDIAIEPHFILQFIGLIVFPVFNPALDTPSSTWPTITS